MGREKKNKRRIHFSQRLFWSVFSLFLGFSFCFLLFQIQRERDFARDKLNSILSNYNYQLFHLTGNVDSIDETVDGFTRNIPHPELRVTIIDNVGKVIYDNNTHAETSENHNDRSEVRMARFQGKGYAIRSSGSTGKQYFYSATDFDGYIYRSALPFDLYTSRLLRINRDFIYFIIAMIIIFFIVLSRFTFSIGETISKLKEFAGEVEKGNMPESDYDFPNDELGDISKNVISLYHKQQEAKEEEGRVKRQLTQNVAHELKTPVSSIQGYLETIISNPDMSAGQMKHFLDRCYSQSSRLTDLLRDISVLNRLDEAKGLFDLSEISLYSLLTEIERECSKEMEEKRITSEIKLPLDSTLFGNHSLLYSIFRNLFDNSIAYAGEGSHIKVECYRKDSVYYYFSFSDNGIGIAGEHLERIFDRFYRIDKGRSRKSGGTGLGLAIVRNGVVFHRGQISAKSNPGKGVTFLFTLKKDIR